MFNVLFNATDDGVACMQEGQKPIYHLEAFVAKFMSQYKEWSMAAFG